MLPCTVNHCLVDAIFQERQALIRVLQQRQIEKLLLLFIDTLEAIHEVLRPKGFEVLIGNYHYSREEEENLLRNYMAYQPRGLLLTGFDRTESSRCMPQRAIHLVYRWNWMPVQALIALGFSQLQPVKRRPGT